MTGPLPRWCDQHQRFECASWLRYTSRSCHGRPMRGTGTCGAHTLRAPATSARELAHQQVSVAVREGVLIRPDACELCPGRLGDWRTWRVEAHHEDYARPLDVLWLCVPCHRRVHGVHGGLAAYVAWLRAQLAAAERLADEWLARCRATA